MYNNFSTNIRIYWNEVLEELSDYELIKINELDKEIFRDTYLDMNCSQLNPKLYIEKVRENLNKKLKSNQNQQLIKSTPKKKKLHFFRKTQ